MEDKIDVRLSIIEKDYPYLLGFLLEPGVLNFFPMSNRKEAEESAKIWISYAQLNSCFTLIKNDEPIGICTIYPHYAKKISHQSLLSIIITEKERGKGYGAFLLKYIEKVAREEFNVSLLHLEVYENNPAQRLYERMGYQVYGMHKHFLKESPDIYKNKILMQKWLE
ncbi:MAG: GNAT family N-acetyltransferase [Chlamydiales bacterium]|nr:GNAT family N-acetyltransferase [Chlamydiales bacterium]